MKWKIPILKTKGKHPHVQQTHAFFSRQSPATTRFVITTKFQLDKKVQQLFNNSARDVLLQQPLTVLCTLADTHPGACRENSLFLQIAAGFVVQYSVCGSQGTPQLHYLALPRSPCLSISIFPPSLNSPCLHAPGFALRLTHVWACIACT